MDKALILNKIKRIKGFDSDKELAEFFGINKATLSNWYKRDTINYNLLFSKCGHLNLNWLLNDKDEPQPQNKDIIDEYTVELYRKHIDMLEQNNQRLEDENKKLKLEIQKLKRGS